MSARRITRFFILAVLSVQIFPYTSCEKFKGDQTVPAYLTIDSIYLTTSLPEQGSASASMVDAWVFVDDDLIGAFQLPARIPILKKGQHALKILPGIKKNGIAATRINYPFYAPVEETVTLAEGDTTALGVLNTTYLPTTLFDLIEGFEGITIALDTTPRSTVGIALTDQGSPLTFEGNHSAMITLDSAGTFFECVNDRDFDIPYAPVFLEMNFNTNTTLVAGVFLYGISIIHQVPILYLNPTGEVWKKIYIDLTNSLNAYSGMQKFRVFFSASRSGTVSEARILMDNIKVVTRKTN